MPGWYIHMNVARKALDDLAANASASAIFAADGMNAADVRQLARDNPAYAALGAIGPDIFFLLPDFKKPTMLWSLFNEIRELYTWWDDNFLGPYESAIGPIGNNAQDLANALTGGLKEAIEGIFSQAIGFLKDEILKLILQQYDFFGILSSGVPSGFDEQSFFWSDMLHYRETYRFAAVLWQRAGDPDIVPDADARDRFRAFALGWMSHLATDVTGHAFVNQKAGGPYRVHWQRHHLVENHMDAQVYTSDHGAQPIYDQMANAALHLWVSFNPDGSSRVNFFDPEPNPPYPAGDHSADITGRHAVWDVDSDMPDDLAQFISDALKAVYWPEKAPPAPPFMPQAPMSPLSDNPLGPIACCPTIISSLDGRVPIQTGGFAEPEDVAGAYWWVTKYMKFTTTDYYKIRRPEPPEPFVIPSFPSPPGSGDSDPGPGATDDSSAWQDFLSFLLALFAWAAYLAEIAIWPAAVVAGIIGGAITLPIRDALYEYLELPLYNLWLGVHTYLAMTGYVMPMPGEVNRGLNTLGVSVADDWQVVVAQLGDPDGGLTPATISTDPSGSAKTGLPLDVVLDPTSAISMAAELGIVGGIPIAGVNPPEFPSEFTRPWRWPAKDNQGDLVNIEHPQSPGGPYVVGMDANALFGAAPGDPAARTAFEAAKNERETIAIAANLLPHGQHLGDPKDYTAYVVARLTRDRLDPDEVVNFNLDADRGYGYLCWDWRRDEVQRSRPDAFKDTGDPSHGGAVTGVSSRQYPSPLEPGYGWDPSDQLASNPGAPKSSFNPLNPQASVSIRYIGREGKF